MQVSLLSGTQAVADSTCFIPLLLAVSLQLRMSKAAWKYFSLLAGQDSWNGSGITPVGITSTYITMEKNECCKELTTGNNPSYLKKWSNVITTRKFCHNISQSLCCLLGLLSLCWHSCFFVVQTIIVCNVQSHQALSLLPSTAYQPRAVRHHCIPVAITSRLPSVPVEKELTAENRSFLLTPNCSFFMLTSEDRRSLCDVLFLHQQRRQSLPFENILINGGVAHQPDFYQGKQGTQEGFWRCEHNSLHNLNTVPAEMSGFHHTLIYLSAHIPLSSSFLRAQSTSAWDAFKCSRERARKYVWEEQRGKA